MISAIPIKHQASLVRDDAGDDKNIQAVDVGRRAEREDSREVEEDIVYSNHDHAVDLTGINATYVEPGKKENNNQDEHQDQDNSESSTSSGCGDGGGGDGGGVGRANHQKRKRKKRKGKEEEEEDRIKIKVGDKVGVSVADIEESYQETTRNIDSSLETNTSIATGVPMVAQLNKQQNNQHLHRQPQDEIRVATPLSIIQSNPLDHLTNTYLQHKPTQAEIPCTDITNRKIFSICNATDANSKSSGENNLSNHNNKIMGKEQMDAINKPFQDSDEIFLRNSNRGITSDNERRYRPQKFCAVCGDKAIACNFNAVTCESCKAFFRRNAFKEQRLKCLFDNRCIIDRVTRRFCSKCRLLKCFQIGMKREWILTDEQKQIKRVKILQNKQSRQTNMKNISIIDTQEHPSYSDDSLINNHSTINEKNVDNIQKEVKYKDASTSCPDEDDLLDPTTRILNYCSMAGHCHYCSIRLNKNTTSSNNFMTPQTVGYSTSNLHDYNSRTHFVTNHIINYQQQDQMKVGLSDRNKTINPAYNLMEHPGDERTTFSSQISADVSTRSSQANCCALNDINHFNRILPANNGQSGNQAEISTSNCHQQCNCRQDMFTTTSNNQDPSANHRSMTASSCLAQNIDTVHATTNEYIQDNYRHRYNQSQNLNPFVMALEVRPLYTSMNQQITEKQASIKPNVELKSNVQLNEPQVNNFHHQLHSNDDLITNMNTASTQIPMAKPVTNSYNTQMSNTGQIGNIITNSDYTTDVKQPCYVINSDRPFNESSMSDHMIVDPTIPQGSTTLDHVNPTQNNDLPMYNTRSKYIMNNDELYYEPANTEQEMKARIESLDFGEYERETIKEMIEATKFLFENAHSHDNHEQQKSLNEIVYFCDAALRRLIKTVKQIKAFRILSMDDQIILLKGACFKILILRSTYHFHTSLDGWIDTKTGKIMRLDFLKRAKKSLVYAKHSDLVNKFPEPLRKDRIVMAIMSLALLFDPNIDLKHSNSVQLDNLIYLNLLRKYLLKTQPEPLTKYQKLKNVLELINACNEEYNVFFSKDFQPEQITPLLIEIFDISIDHNSLE